jgi:UDP-N-acetyl-D-mannosaminuronate dehydrogenase
VADKVLVIGNGTVGSRVLGAAKDAGYDARPFDTDGARSRFPVLEDGLEWGDIWIICLPTRALEGRPDCALVGRAIEQMATYRKEADLICLESTVPPGFCRRQVNRWPNLQFAYCPERIWVAGEPKWHIGNITRVIACPQAETLGKAMGFYATLTRVGHVPTFSYEEAELCKVYENLQRAVCILLAHELRRVCEDSGVETDAVLRLARSKPFGYSDYHPGKIEGECIPMAPFFFPPGGLVTTLREKMTSHLWWQTAEGESGKVPCLKS